MEHRKIHFDFRSKTTTNGHQQGATCITIRGEHQPQGDHGWTVGKVWRRNAATVERCVKQIK